MMSFRVLASLLFCLGLFGACDSLGGASESSTTCLYAHTAEAGAVEDFAQSCESDADCSFGVCMMPGDKGNLSNGVFGFCTRACDCDCGTDPDCTQSVSSSDPNWSCAYPGGCWTGESQGQWRHVLKKCGSVADCQAIDSRYTHCAKTYLENALNDPDKLCGQDHKVCQAIP